MSFQNYYVNTPAAANNPSNDQPLMETNTNSASQLWLQDHYGFKDNLGGQHKQVTFSKGSVGDNVPGAQSGVNSVVFTNAGIDDPAHPELYFINSTSTFPLSCIRAFARFTTTSTPGAVTLINSYNVTSGAFSTHNYDFTLPAGVISSVKALALITFDSSTYPIVSYTFTSVTNLNINITNTVNVGVNGTFVIFQI